MDNSKELLDNIFVDVDSNTSLEEVIFKMTITKQ
jgi:hypothetical protein